MNSRYMTMIIPSRWLNGGKGLDSYRQEMLRDKRLVKLVDYADSKDCFPSVDISGGISYFLWSRDSSSDDCTIVNVNKGGLETSMVRCLNEFPTFIRKK